MKLLKIALMLASGITAGMSIATAGDYELLDKVYIPLEGGPETRCGLFSSAQFSPNGDVLAVAVTQGVIPFDASDEGLGNRWMVIYEEDPASGAYEAIKTIDAGAGMSVASYAFSADATVLAYVTEPGEDPGTGSSTATLHIRTAAMTWDIAAEFDFTTAWGWPPTVVVANGGETIIVGDGLADGPTTTQGGRLRVYSNASGTWSSVQTIDPPAAVDYLWFGQSVWVDSDDMHIYVPWANGGYKVTGYAVDPASGRLESQQTTSPQAGDRTSLGAVMGMGDLIVTASEDDVATPASAEFEVNEYATTGFTVSAESSHAVAAADDEPTITSAFGPYGYGSVIPVNQGDLTHVLVHDGTRYVWRNVGIERISNAGDTYPLPTDRFVVGTFDPTGSSLAYMERYYHPDTGRVDAEIRFLSSGTGAWDYSAPDLIIPTAFEPRFGNNAGMAGVHQSADGRHLTVTYSSILHPNVADPKCSTEQPFTQGALAIYGAAWDATSSLRGDEEVPTSGAIAYTYEVQSNEVAGQYAVSPTVTVDLVLEGAVSLDSATSTSFACSVTGLTASCTGPVIAGEKATIAIQATAPASAGQVEVTAETVADVRLLDAVNTSRTATTFVVTPPVASDSSIEVAEGGTARGHLDIRADGGESVSVTIVDPPSHGTIEVDGTAFTYTPDLGFTGPDAFQFRGSNSLYTSNTGTVSIEVLPATDPTADDVSMTLQYDDMMEPGTEFAGVLEGQTFMDLEPSYTIVSQPEVGSAEVRDPASGEFVYVQGEWPTDEPYVETFTYRVTDPNGRFAEATVTVTVCGSNGCEPDAGSDSSDDSGDGAGDGSGDGSTGDSGGNGTSGGGGGGGGAFGFGVLTILAFALRRRKLRI